MQPDLNSTTTPPDNAPPPKPKIDLSVSKVLGGALAAMTAAALGSRLSVAGTIVGAALASVVAAVAGSLYTASLKRTQDKVRTVWTGRTGQGAEPTSVEVRSGEQPAAGWWAPAQPSAPEPTPTSASASASTQVMPAVAPPTPPRTRVSWKSIVVGAVAAFGIAAVALTGFEAISGHALSGGDGTTITQVSEPKKPTTKPSAAATKQSASPSASPTQTSSTPAPSETTSSKPSTAPSASASSTPGVAQPSSSGSATPSATASPSASG